ncbi:ATP-binding protein [Tepidanaerobacter acetatoxydans]|uniref:ATP-binding protein n=1 Tax=Tepidanaerobacter acetatoxydans TaxID=499229 RepID=UPI001BD577AC|nr:ATP-binding protein [Tepidanaerobacter acetatoxydans]
MTKHKFVFSPRVLYEALGAKHIEMDSIAFAEQIKNSRDAEAKNIIINLADYNEDRINILDDGIGMNEEELKKNWLLVGTESKSIDSKALGGKGIGRFSLFRIAENITIISKKKNCPEYEMSIKRSVLESLDFTDNLEIEIIENKTPRYFKNNLDSGTNIILTGIKELNFKQIFNQLKNLIQPDKVASFPVNIKYTYPKLIFTEPTIMSIDDALAYAPFRCTASFISNNLLEYNFTCKVKNKIIYTKKDTKKLSSSFAELKPINLGKIDFNLYNFYFDPTFVSLLSIPQKEIQENFLEIYQGISVYREGFKIYGHGENDWLQLAEKRVANPTECIDNKLSFGYISLKRPESDKLEEKTNREGFIKGPVYDYFKEATEFLVIEFNKDRTNSIDIIRNGERKRDFKIIHEIILNEEKRHQTSNENIRHSNSNKTFHDDTDSSKSDEPPKETPNSESKSLKTENSDSDKEKQKPQTEKPEPKYSDKVIIDSSFICPDTAPEKIKKIIYELQTVENTFRKPTLYSQALLLRCLIDISTQYAQIKLPIKRNNEDLSGNIENVLNYLSSKKKLLDRKHIIRARNELRNNKTVTYFNGVAHDYNYRPNHDDIKRIWDAFESYIAFCIKQ